MRNFLKPFSFLPAILLMYMIYSFSAQEAEASSALSYKASYTMVKAADRVLDAGLEEWEMQSLATRFNGVTRKLAHMAEYFALAIAVSFPLYVYGLHGFLLMLLAGFICVAFACTDEYHQSFVSGRSPAVRDVMIDSFGVFWGIVLVRIIGWTGRKTIFRPRRKKAIRDEYDYEYPEYSCQPRYARTHPDDLRRAPYDGAYPGSSHQTRYSEHYADNYGRVRYDSPYPADSRQPYHSEPHSEHSQRPYFHENNRHPFQEQDYADDFRDTRYPQYANEYGTDHYEPVEEQRGSDRLAEDMSFKRLIQNIREQHREEREENK